MRYINEVKIPANGKLARSRRLTHGCPQGVRSTPPRRKTARCAQTLRLLLGYSRRRRSGRMPTPAARKPSPIASVMPPVT